MQVVLAGKEFKKIQMDEFMVFYVTKKIYNDQKKNYVPGAQKVLHHCF